MALRLQILEHGIASILECSMIAPRAYDSSSYLAGLINGIVVSIANRVPVRIQRIRVS